jgi:hypothetical protein
MRVNDMSSYSSRLLAWVDTLEQLPVPDEEQGTSSYEIDLIIAGRNASLLRSILKDHEVAAAIDRVAKAKEKSPTPNENTLEQLKRFIIDTASIVGFSKPARSRVEIDDRPIYRSDRIKKMEALANQSKALAARIRRLNVECSSWASVEYLELRHRAGSPYGFSAKRRGFFPFSPSASTTIDDLLSSFADDTAEQVELMKASIKRDRKSGGKTSPDRVLTMLLGASCRRHLGKSYPSLIAFIISAATGIDNDISTTAKRLKAP